MYCYRQIIEFVGGERQQLPVITLVTTLILPLSVNSVMAQAFAITPTV